MDANRLNFWMISKPAQWQTSAESGIEVTAHGSVRLASQRSAPDVPVVASEEIRIKAEKRLKLVSGTMDGHGTWARQDKETLRLVAGGAAPGSTPVAELDSSVSSLAIGHDDILYMVVGDSIVMIDQRSRWNRADIQCVDFQPSSIAPGVGGGLWVLDRSARRIARLAGQPLSSLSAASHSEHGFYKDEPNPNAPHLELVQSPDWDDDEQPVSMASHPDGRLAVLCWQVDGTARVWCMQTTGEWSQPTQLSGIPYAYSIAWCDQNRLALLAVPFTTEAPACSLAPGETVLPLGDFYPLHEHNGAPFLTSLDTRPHYQRADGEICALRSLSLSTFASRGTITGWAFQRQANGSSEDAAVERWPLDSGRTETVWHRLYIESRIPSQCGVIVELAATNDPRAEIKADDWHPHRFGESESAAVDGTPCGVWVDSDSEIPFHTGLIGCPSERNRCGLFTALVQRSNRPVRRLSGRFLHVRVTLKGNGRTSPEVFAVRAYASRHSYVDHYLPDFYSESRLGADADTIIETTEQSTPADFLDRFLGLFESVLTPLEDRIASSWLLTDPRTVPDESLEWLAGWLGVNFDPLYPAEVRRSLLCAAPEMARSHGTLRGLKLLLDILTSGAVSDGRIVVLEDFRLRRTFATILGVRLDNADNPLLAGTGTSGNSLVGETLFLGDGNEHEEEFLSLFGTNLPDARQEADIIEFFDRLAYRVTVLAHESIDATELGRIERAVEREVPAHVVATVQTASGQFLTGVTSLLGVQSSLAPEAPLSPVRLGSTHLGRGDRVFRSVSLDPRLVPDVLSPRTDHAKAAQLYALDSENSFALVSSDTATVDGETVHSFVWKLI